MPRPALVLTLALTLHRALGTDPNDLRYTAYQPDLSQISPTVANSWCPHERAICPLLCGGRIDPPTYCDAARFAYRCVCADGSWPDSAAYAGSLEANMCAAYVSLCVVGNTTDPAAQRECLRVRCGTRDPWTAPPERPVESKQPVTSPGPTLAELRDLWVAVGVVVGMALFVGACFWGVERVRSREGMAEGGSKEESLDPEERRGLLESHDEKADEAEKSDISVA